MASVLRCGVDVVFWVCASFFAFYGLKVKLGYVVVVAGNGTIVMAYCTCPGWLWGWRIWWNKNWHEQPKYSEKTCPSDTLSTTNPTWPDSVSNPAAAVGSQRLTASAMARPIFCVHLYTEVWSLLDTCMSTLEPTVPGSGRSKTVHAIDRSTTVTGHSTN
jgi:hypothetical protein